MCYLKFDFDFNINPKCFCDVVFLHIFSWKKVYDDHDVFRQDITSCVYLDKWLWNEILQWNSEFFIFKGSLLMVLTDKTGSLTDQLEVS